MKSKKILLITFFLASFLFGSKAVYAGQECKYIIDSSESERALKLYGMGVELIFNVYPEENRVDVVRFNNYKYHSESSYTDVFNELYFQSGNNCPQKVYQCRQIMLQHATGNERNIYLSKTDDSSKSVGCFEYNYFADSDVKPTPNPDNTCESVFGEKLLKKLNEYFNIFKIVVPILVIVLSSLDFAKSILNSDSDDFKKSQIKFAKRLVLSVVFFLLPIILNFILQAINSSMSTCGIG